MPRVKYPSSRAKMPRLHRTIEVIQLVREERSKKARGDFLLHQAQISLSSCDTDSAKACLEKFLDIAAPDVTAEHHACISVLLSKFLDHRKFRIPSTILNLADVVLTILKLVARNLLSCSFHGSFSGLYRPCLTSKI